MSDIEILDNIVVDSEESKPSKAKEVKKVRTRNVDEWKKVKAKKNRSRGLEYVNTSGKLIPARVFKDINCNCKAKCNEKIKPEERRKVFEQFYELGNQTLQNLYLRGQVQIQEVRRHRPKDKSRSEKTQSFYYYIRVGKKNIKICKKYFRDTFQVGNSRLHRSCSVENIVDLVDKRGRKHSSNKVDTKDAEEHMLSFPTYTDPNAKGAAAKRRYLDCNLTLQEIYDSYVEHCKVSGTKPVKKSMYYHVMRSKFQIYFPKPPSRDQTKREVPEPSALKKVIRIPNETIISQPSTSQTIQICNAIDTTVDTSRTMAQPTATIVYTQVPQSKILEGLNIVQPISGQLQKHTGPAQVIILKDSSALQSNLGQSIVYCSPNQNQGDQMFFY